MDEDQEPNSQMEGSPGYGMEMDDDMMGDPMDMDYDQEEQDPMDMGDGYGGEEHYG